MFRDPRDPINDRPIIDDGLDDDIGGGGGGIVPPIDDPIEDTTPPVINDLKVTPSTINLSSQNPSAAVTITAFVFDFESPLTNVHLDGLGASTISGASYTWNKTYYFSSFSSGTHTQSLTLSALNSNGMFSNDSVNLQVIVEADKPKDFEAPNINSFTVNDNTVTLNNTQTTQTVTFTANITDNVNISLYSVSNAIFKEKSGNDYLFTKTFSFSNYDFGDTTDTFTIVAADDAGNIATKSLNITITKIDTQAPSINSFTSNLSSVSLTSSSQSASVTFTATVSDNVGISSVDLPGASLVFTYSNSYTFSKTYYYNSYSLGSNTDTRTLTVTDTNGNTTSSSINISITKTDTQSPSIISFSANDTSVTLNTSNTKTQLVTFTAEVNDNHGINTVSLPGTTPTGSSGNIYTFTKLFDQALYSFGNTIQSFTLTAIDDAGNSSNSTESVTVSKTDTSGPTITTFSTSSNDFTLTTSLKTRLVTFTVVVADNLAVKTITVSGATPLESGGGGGGGGGGVLPPPPIDGPGDEIIIDENKIVNDIIQLESNDTTPGTSNTFYFVKTYNYDNYSYGSNTDNVIASVTDLNDNVVTAGLDVNFSKVDTQAPTISSFTTVTILHLLGILQEVLVIKLLLLLL